MTFRREKEVEQPCDGEKSHPSLAGGSIPLSVLAVCGDPGGAAAIAPVVGRLRGRGGIRLTTFAYGPGVQVMRAAGIDCGTLPPDSTAGTYAEIWRSASPDVLLSASSVNEYEHEKQFIRMARARDVPSLVVMDSWSSYGRRFGPCAGQFDALPDKIAVMDDRARLEWIEAGVEPERLVITGQPSFDALSDLRTAFTDGQKTKIRLQLGVRADEWMVVFLSQPIRQLTLEGDARYIYPGYDQQEVFGCLLQTLRTAAATRGKPGVIVLRPHPREIHPPEFEPGDHVRVVVDRSVDTRELMLCADLVAGMASIAVVEACYMGCLTISLQPGALYPEAVASNIAGASASVRTWQDFRDVLERMLFDSVSRQGYVEKLARFSVDGKSTERVIELLLHMARVNDHE